MANKKWRGLMKVLSFQHLDKNGNVIWETKDLRNTMHLEGEEFVLNVMFGGGSLPSSYYVGLDDRDTLATADTLADLVSEPGGDGYVRQAIANNSFTVALATAKYQATSGIVTFVSSGNSWGPVKNIFLATTVDDTGILVGTAAIGQDIDLDPGESVSMRIAMSLGDGS